MKKIILLTTLMAIGAHHAFAQLNRFNEDAWYTIVATHSNKALEIKGGSAENGIQLQQADSTGADNQLFRFKKAAGGYYQIIVKQSGKALQIRNASVKDHEQFEQGDITGKDDQLFTMIKAANGTSAIVLKLSGYGFDVLGGAGAMAGGTPIIQYQTSGAPNQYFRIIQKQ